MDEKLLQLLNDLSIALDDWLHTFAGDLCDPKDVEESMERCRKSGGRLIYIADLRRRIKEYKERN